MKYEKKHQILSAAANEESRYMINGVKFEKGEDGAGKLIATNGRILAVVPVTDTDGDVDGIISADALKLAGKGSKKGETTIASIDSDLGPIARVFGKDSVTADFPHQENNFPSWEVVLPKPSTTDLSVTLSGQYLKDLVDALGVKGDALDGIRFQFKLDDKGQIDGGAPVRVDAADPGNDAHGCIMPICSV